MKNYLHKFLAFFFAAFCLSVNAKADTSILLESEGWTKITEMPQNLGDYYFAFVDNSNDLMLTMGKGGNQGKDYYTMYYKASSNPLHTKAALWTIEGDNYTVRNVEYTKFAMQTENNAAWNYRTHDQPNACQWTATIPAYSLEEACWTIQNGKYPDSGYLGPWNDANFTDGAEVALNKTGANVGKFQIYAIKKSSCLDKAEDATPENPVDMTMLLKNINADLEVVGSGGWTTELMKRNGGVGYDGKGGFFELGNWGGTSWNASMKQTLSSLPNGKYIVKAAAQASSTDVVLTLTANDVSQNLNCIGDAGGNIKADGSVVELGQGVAGWQYMTVECMVTNGELTIIASSTASAVKRWANIDNFTVVYVDPTISEKSMEFPADGNLVADQWYVLDIATAGDYGLSATEGIVYTQDANALYSQIEASAAAETLTLAAGKLFVKSAAAQTLTVTPKTFAYEVGAGSSAIEKKYLQTLSEVVVNFADAATNDPDAVLALLVDDAVATLKKGDEVVASGTLAVEGKDLKATFTEVNLELGSAYTIEIPADIFGYEGKAANEAAVVNFYTPLVADGVYYLYNVASGTYLSRGKAYGTQAAMDEFGLALNVATDQEGKTTFQYFDSKMYLGDDNPCYTDTNTDKNRMRSYILTAVEGGYKLQNTNNQKYLAEADGAAVGDAEDGAANIVWKLETPAPHAAAMEALKAAQIAKVIADAGVEATTVEELEAAFSYKQEISITKPAAIAEVYQKDNAKINDQTIKVDEGLYKLSVYAFSRMASKVATYDAHGKKLDYPVAYIYANGEKVQIASLMDSFGTAAYDEGKDYNPVPGQYYPDNLTAAGKAFDAGHYENVLYIYIAEDGTDLNIGLSAASNAKNENWVAYRDFTLMRYYNNGTPATEEDKKAFEEALNEAKAKVVGFAKGEYAPYNNVEAVKALAAAVAKANTVDVDAAAKEVIVEATEALVALETYEWVQNAEEMNAVYNGDFALCENNGAMPGWRMSNNTLGGDYHSRAFVGDARMSEFNETNSGAFLRFDKTNSSRGSMYYYGDTEGYPMPLKAGQKYSLTVDFAGWGSTGKPLRLNVEGPAGFTAVNEQHNTEVQADVADNTPQQFKIEFTATVAGNYKISFQTPGPDTNTHTVVVSNIKLYTAPTEVTGVTLNQDAVVLEKGQTVQLVATIEPADATDQSLTWTTSDDKVATVSDGLVTAVAEGEATITVTTANGKTATCVVTVSIADAINVVNVDAETVIYDLAGRRVEKAVKGIYIVNGKKVIK